MNTENEERTCTKCRGLCEDFTKTLYSKDLANTIGSCVFKGFNFSIWTSPRHKNLIVTQYGLPGESGSGEVSDCLEILLAWKDLQFEDAIRLAKVDKNV